MIKRYEKVFALLLTFFLCFGLCSCSNTNNTAEKISIRYVEAVEAYKNNLKDLSSMRIYGDVIVSSMIKENSSIISLVCDGKNSYGGYGGKEIVDICLMPESEIFWLTEDSESFVDIRSMYDNYEKLSQENKEKFNDQIKFEVISGAELAQKVGAEYYDN